MYSRTHRTLGKSLRMRRLAAGAPGRSLAVVAVSAVLATLSLPLPAADAGYLIGVGIADATGPAAEVNFMGYANPDQKGQGIHLRQFSRAFVFEDEAGERLAFVSVDCGMIGSGLRKEVLKRLAKRPNNRYTEKNLMLSGTHTHSAPGGFLMHLLFDITTLGFIKDSFDGLAEGITKSIEAADESMVPGRVFVAKGELHGANINRSPTAYENNPPDERAQYEHDTDRVMTQLKLVREDDRPLGVINWFAVHPTSMNNTNRLISSDNLGTASIFFEQRMNGQETILGRGPFVSAFASSNLGDVSPNTRGPRCQFSGKDCDVPTSSCGGKEQCIASGPGDDMFESTRIIGDRLYRKAWDLYTSNEHREVKGPLFSVHQYSEIPGQEAEFFNMRTNKVSRVRACLPAMGYSFAAGTTDGAGASPFMQGTRSTNPMWNSLRNFVMQPTVNQVSCHGAKPILLTTGEMNFPFEWQPTIVSQQVAVIGDVALACVPGEFTTMAGRRLRTALYEVLRDTKGAPAPRGPEDVVIVGLCNTYSDYITTPEEYEVQRYEGASTIYGPHTLTIHLKNYRALARSIVERAQPDPGPTPPELMNDLITLLPPVLFDTAVWEKQFGDVLEQPEAVYGPGDTVYVSFVSGHPRNDARRGDTFLTVERKEREIWRVIATDANWETRMIWERVSAILGSSRVIVTWTVPNNAPEGEYRIRHFGHYKSLLSGIAPYNGTSRTFKVTSDIDTGAQEPMLG